VQGRKERRREGKKEAKKEARKERNASMVKVIKANTFIIT
jgi:predicted HNH restriction endonuclease